VYDKIAIKTGKIENVEIKEFFYINLNPNDKWNSQLELRRAFDIVYRM